MAGCGRRRRARAGPCVSVLAGFGLGLGEKLGFAASGLGGIGPLGRGVSGYWCEGGCVVPAGKFSGLFFPPSLTLKREATWKVLFLNIL